MPLQFAVLASGSRGNASFIKAGGAGLLVDFGVGPKTIETRLGQVGASWRDVHAVVLTHTHGDHVDDATLGRLAANGVPLYCHEGHVPQLAALERFAEVVNAGLLRHYDDRPFLTPDGLRVEPIELSHDGGPTFGFRVEGRDARRSRPVSLGYLADTGMWTAAMADMLDDVDLLGVEFNHDVEMTRRSGRSPRLIARNLGNRGHLSNDQGASLVRAILHRSSSGGPKHVVLLHLSQECNRPDLALSTARAAIRGTGRRVGLHAAEQSVSSANLLVDGRARRSQRARQVADLPF